MTRRDDGGINPMAAQAALGQQNRGRIQCVYQAVSTRRIPFNGWAVSLPAAAVTISLAVAGNLFFMSLVKEGAPFMLGYSYPVLKRFYDSMCVPSSLSTNFVISGFVTYINWQRFKRDVFSYRLSASLGEPLSAARYAARYIAAFTFSFTAAFLFYFLSTFAESQEYSYPALSGILSGLQAFYGGYTLIQTLQLFCGFGKRSSQLEERNADHLLGLVGQFERGELHAINDTDLVQPMLADSDSQGSDVEEGENSDSTPLMGGGKKEGNGLCRKAMFNTFYYVSQVIGFAGICVLNASFYILTARQIEGMWKLTKGGAYAVNTLIFSSVICAFADFISSMIKDWVTPSKGGVLNNRKGCVAATLKTVTLASKAMFFLMNYLGMSAVLSLNDQAGINNLPVNLLCDIFGTIANYYCAHVMINEARDGIAKRWFFSSNERKTYRDLTLTENYFRYRI